MTARPDHHVLVVDDDATTAQGLQQMLGRLGLQAQTCAGLGALDAVLPTGSWDAVLLDMELDGGNVLDFLPAVSQRHKLPPTVLVSGQASARDIARALRGPVVDFLPKPYQPFEVAAALDRALGADRYVCAYGEEPVPLLRRTAAAMVWLFNKQLLPAEARATVADSPRLRAAAWLASTWPTPPASRSEAISAGVHLVSAAVTATACSIEGAWHEAAVREARHAHELASFTAACAHEEDLTPGHGWLIGALTGVGALALIAARARTAGGERPDEAQLTEVRAKAAAHTFRVLDGWGLPTQLLAAVGLREGGPRTRACAVLETGVARLRGEQRSRAAPETPAKATTSGAEEGKDELWQAQVRGTLLHLDRPRDLRLPDTWPGTATLRAGDQAVPLEVYGVSGPRLLAGVPRDHQAAARTLITTLGPKGAQVELAAPRLSTMTVPVDPAAVLAIEAGPTSVRMLVPDRRIEAVRAHLLRLIDRRRSVRVLLTSAQPIDAVLEHDGRQLRVSLADISLEGVGVLAPTTAFLGLRPGDLATLRVLLGETSADDVPPATDPHKAAPRGTDADEPDHLRLRCVYRNRSELEVPSGPHGPGFEIGLLGLELKGFPDVALQREWTSLVMDVQRQRQRLRGRRR
jgi:CheY-like chemotaxis protein